jgi:hypothetical protein
MRLCFVFCLLLVASVFVPIASFGQGQAYTVEKLEISLPDGAAGKRREQALERAVTEGFSRLLKKLTPPEVWPRHAWLMSTLSPQTALDKVSIVGESLSPTYVLTVDVSYKRDLVRELLTSHSIPFSEVQATTVLIIPVYEVGRVRVLWEENNPWRQALRQGLLREGVLAFTLPAGDMAEMGRLTANMAVLGAQDILLDMAKTYGAQSVIVARAQPQAGGLRGRLVVRAQWYTLGEGQEFAPVNLHLPLSRGEDVAPALVDAAAELYHALETAWKQAGLVASDKPRRAFIRFAGETPAARVAFERRLQALVSVQRVSAKLISKNENVYQVDFFGEIENLRQQLQPAGYRLGREGGMWRVRVITPEPDQP